MSGECRPLRRRLRPLAWLALEEVALDAVLEDGRLVARTSARRVAELLRVDPGTAAAALRALRQEGVLALEREKGTSGRFGLSVYVLRPIAGFYVVGPIGDGPAVAPASLGTTNVGTPVVAPSGTEAPGAEHAYTAMPRTVVSHVASASGPSLRIPPEGPERADHSPTRTPSALPGQQVPGQQTLELDGGVA
jgi:DNA-binding transcriptional ArsR family regulator